MRQLVFVKLRRIRKSKLLPSRRKKLKRNLKLSATNKLLLLLTKVNRLRKSRNKKSLRIQKLQNNLQKLKLLLLPLMLIGTLKLLNKNLNPRRPKLNLVKMQLLVL